MSKFLVLFGPPGCGKGTQAARLKDAMGVPHVSTGDMFRDHKARETDLGKKVQEIMDAGKLVPDEVTDAMVKERLGRDDVAEGVLLDGYPRNVHQAKELQAILGGYGKALDGVIAIEVPDDELKARLKKRAEGSGRKDDMDPATIQRRLDVYKEQSAPCIAHYEGTNATVHRIDGVGSIEEISTRILTSLGA